MNDTALLVLDGKRVSEGAPEGRNDEVEILPGRHKLEVALFWAEPLKLRTMTMMYYARPVTICMDAQPGRRYVILPAKVQNGWMPVVRDEEATSSSTIAARDDLPLYSNLPWTSPPTTPTLLQDDPSRPPYWHLTWSRGRTGKNQCRPGTPHRTSHP